MPLDRKTERSEAVRLVSNAVVATMLGVTRGTVQGWIDDGCPVVNKAAGKGQANELDIAEVVDWLMKRAEKKGLDRGLAAAEDAIADGSLAEDGGESKDQAETRRARAMANIAEFKEAIEAGSVTPNDVVIDMVRADYAAVRARFENVPNTLATRTAQIDDPTEIEKIATELVTHALKPLKVELVNAA